MGELSYLPNIGKVVESKLNEAGIFTKEQLMKAGGKGAFVKIRAKDPEACLNMLYGLEGAVAGVRWHSLPNSKKAELKDFFNSL